MSRTRRLIFGGSVAACILLVAAAVVFVNVGLGPKTTTITDGPTPLAAPLGDGSASGSMLAYGDDGAGAGVTGAPGKAPISVPLVAGAPGSADELLQVLSTDRSKEIILPPDEAVTPNGGTDGLVWHEPWDEMVWVPVSYWKKTHHVEVYGTREIAGSVCFDGTPLPSDLSPKETADFVAAHGGGYSTGVVSYEVYLLRPAYVERELVQGGTYKSVRHEGYWSYS